MQSSMAYSSATRRGRNCRGMRCQEYSSTVLTGRLPLTMSIPGRVRAYHKHRGSPGQTARLHLTEPDIPGVSHGLTPGIDRLSKLGYGGLAARRAIVAER